MSRRIVLAAAAETPAPACKRGRAPLARGASLLAAAATAAAADRRTLATYASSRAPGYAGRGDCAGVVGGVRVACGTGVTRCWSAGVAVRARRRNVASLRVSPARGVSLHRIHRHRMQLPLIGGVSQTVPSPSMAGAWASWASAAAVTAAVAVAAAQYWEEAPPSDDRWGTEAPPQDNRRTFYYLPAKVKRRPYGQMKRELFKRRLSTKDPLSHTIYHLESKLGIGTSTARSIALTLQQKALSVDAEDPTGTKTKKWARRLERGLRHFPMLRGKIMKGPEAVLEVLDELEKRSARHGERFATISGQHRSLASDGNPPDDLENYSDAAAYIANSWWMRCLHEKIASRIDEYYLLSGEQLLKGFPRWAFQRDGVLPPGWKRYKVKDKVTYWNPDKFRMQLEPPPLPSTPEGQAVPGEPEPRMPPVALLDVGSCTNPFARESYLVDPVAIDLRPSQDAEGRVYEADFFDLQLFAPTDDHKENKRRTIVDDDGTLLGIVVGSFDVVVLSLVLSFVPTPQQRIDMIKRARSCLRDDRGLLFVAEVGSTLADQSWYHKDAAMEWSRSIEQCGFTCLRFDEQVEEFNPYRSHIVYQWIFETAPLRTNDGDTPLRPPQPLYKGKELPWA